MKKAIAFVVGAVFFIVGFIPALLICSTHGAGLIFAKFGDWLEG